MAWITVAAATASVRTTSGTFDETLYLDLARRAFAEGGTRSFADLGVAPLPVMIAWDHLAVAPVALPASDATAYVGRVTRARSNAIWWFAVPLVVGSLLWLTLRHGVAAVVACLAALTAFMESQTAVRGALLAMALGLALATKYSAPGMFLSAAVAMWIDRRTRRKRYDLLVLVSGLVVAWAADGFATAPLAESGGRFTQAAAALGAGAGWAGEWLASLPSPLWIRSLAAQLYLEREGQEAFLLGQRSTLGWWYYFPVAIVLKSTPVELAALAAFAAWSVRHWRTDVETRVWAITAAVFAVLPLASHRNLGVRYVLPVVIMAAIGSARWLGRMSESRRRLTVVAIVVAAQGASFWSITPQYLAYFNTLAGGPANGYRRLVDSNLDWGQDLPRLAAWLGDHHTRRVRLAYFGTAPPSAYGIDALDYRADPDARESPVWLALSVTHLQGVFICGDPFEPFRPLVPDGRPGYSIMIYSVDRPEVSRGLRLAIQNTCDS